MQHLAFERPYGYADLIFRLVVLATRVALSTPAQSGLIVPPDAGCACPGNELIYTCTAVGGGLTIWEGTALRCIASSISLFHHRYANGAIGACDNIRARSVSVDNNCYTSQLIVPISGDSNNRSVVCAYDSGFSVETIGTSILMVIEGPFSSPYNVRLIDVQEGILVFSWDSFGSDCEAADYRIMSSCGTCPNITNSTRAICSNLNLSADVNECTFSILAMLCGVSARNPSDPINVALKLPDAPDILQVIPVYSNVNSTLRKIIAVINQSRAFDIADGISESVRNYNLSLASNSGIDLTSTFLPSCVDRSCEIVATISQCPLRDVDVNITISAANRLGYGPMSDTARIGCINNFVEVEYDSAASTITCSFREPTVSSNICFVDYGDCQNLMFTSNGSTGIHNNIITLKLQLSGMSQVYCYVVTASNGVHTVMVEGEIHHMTATVGLSTGSVVAIVFALVVFLLICGILITAMVLAGLWKLKDVNNKDLSLETETSLLGQGDCELQSVLANSTGVNSTKESTPGPVSGATPEQETAVLVTYATEEKTADSPSQSDDPFVVITMEPTIKLKKVDFEVVMTKVEEPTDVITFLNEEGYPENFDCAHEFLSEEDISKKDEIIFVSTKTLECFYPDEDRQTLRENNLLGKGLSPPFFNDYRVFVRGSKPKTRQLQAGKVLLYKSPELEVLVSKPKQHQIICIDVTKFAMRKTTEDCTMRQFFAQCSPSANSLSIYHEVDRRVDDQVTCDVLLMHKKTQMIYSGTSAMNVAKEGVKDGEAKHWRIFARIEYREESHLKKDTCILYQTEQSFQDQLDLPLVSVDKGLFAVAPKPKGDCTIKEFRQSHRLDNNEHVFVLVNDSRELVDVLDVILEDKTTGELYTCASSGFSRLDSALSTIPKWRMFIMKNFCENTLITTEVLYRVRVEQCMTRSKNLLPIQSDHFVNDTVPQDYKTLKDYRATLSEISQEKVFVELLEYQDHDDIADVILMEKGVDSMKLYSGPYARKIFEENLEAVIEKWQVFVLCKKMANLKKGTSVLYQNPDTVERQYYVLQVEDGEDGMHMSEFIKKRLDKVVYEDHKVFSELVQEDLLSYKETLRVPLDIINGGKDGQVVELKSHTSLFYGISGVPGWGIKPQYDRKDNFKVFVQNVSQGSKCLESGALILYKESVKNMSSDTHRVNLIT